MGDRLMSNAQGDGRSGEIMSHMLDETSTNHVSGNLADISRPESHSIHVVAKPATEGRESNVSLKQLPVRPSARQSAEFLRVA